MSVKLVPDTHQDRGETAADDVTLPDAPEATALLGERLLTFQAATRHPALRGGDGRPCHVAKVYRLVSHGAVATDGRRVRLESIRVPGGLRTSLQAIDRLVHRLTFGAGPQAPPVTTVAERRRRRQVDAELDRAGIG